MASSRIKGQNRGPNLGRANDYSQPLTKLLPLRGFASSQTTIHSARCHPTMEHSTQANVGSFAQDKDIQNEPPNEEVAKRKRPASRRAGIEDYEMYLRSIYESISKIIKGSTNESFRRRCFYSFQVDNTQSLEKKLWENIVQIAQKKLKLRDVKLPNLNEHETRDEFTEADGLEFF